MKSLRSHSIFWFFNFNRYCVFVALLVCVTVGNLIGEETDLSKGKKLFYSGSYKKAEKILKKAIRNDSMNAEAYYFLGFTVSRILGKYNAEIPQTSWKATEKMSQYFEKALAIETEYTGECYILSPQDKLMSEWSVLALRYLYEDDEKMAQNALNEMKKRGGFNIPLSEFMHNMLHSCPPHAILFTYGDMDTFHGLYLQVMEKYRTDVTIVNIHLLRNLWYIHYLKRTHNRQKNGITFPFSDEDFRNTKQFQKKYQNPFSFTIPSIGCKNYEKKRVISITPLRDKNPDFLPPVNELVLMKLIEGNADKPLCFALTVPPLYHGYYIEIDGKKLSLDSVLELEGLVNRLTFCKKDPYSQAQKLKNMIEKEYQFSAIPQTTAINTLKMFNFYVACITQVAQSLEHYHDTEAAKNLISSFVNRVPGIQYLDNKKMRTYLLGASGKKAQ